METGYVLELENNKYYIGITKNIVKRLREHNNGYGSKWTQVNKPKRCIEYFEYSKREEREYTIKYMKLYGWENVRGAGWTATNLMRPFDHWKCDK